ncbi:MAG TPA: exodeoxyribonuclease VII large subunit [Tepidiformaceae bacterium]|nr:exodeoxyribonuclease VII large subunit [Tepidiformaceae bacterium]
MQALSVSAIVGFLREVLESNEIFSDLWVVGEVSNYSRSAAGHRYYSLKDPGAVLRCVMFNSAMPGMQLNDGDRVLAHGKITIYPQRGDLQFVVDFVRPEGVGILAARYEELKQRLGEEGLFDPARKRPLPRFPRRIGLVTSPTGAALQDIKNVLTRRWPMAEMVLAPAVVQGEQAAPTLVGALRQLSRERDLDLAIVARGGGSIEDLWGFNDERVARAIFGFPVPVVTGVGHETDETIADLVADVRAPTPSAAAERTTPDLQQVERALVVLSRAMASASRETVATRAAAVEMSIARLRRGAPQTGDLAHEIRGMLRDLQAGLERRCAADRARFEGASARLRGLDPYATLARGFAIVQKADTKKVVNSVRRVKPGDRLNVAVSDGAFWTEVS